MRKEDYMCGKKSVRGHVSVRERETEKGSERLEVKAEET